MNDRLEAVINGWAGHSGLLDGVMKVAATDLTVVVGVALLALWFWPARAPHRATNQRLVVAAMLGAAGALAAGALVGMVHPESRPFATDRSAHLLIAHAADNGLPSDHALVSFGVAGVMVWWRRAIGMLLLALGIVMGIARVYVSVHWPGDIVVGALIGLLAGGLAAFTVPWWAGPLRWGSRFLPPQLLARP